jgi:hypothetical protein
MWQLEPTTQWERDKKWYDKKRPQELAAVLHNLGRYLTQLNTAPNPRAFTAGYIHPEPLGVVAIDQRGGGANLQETRLYVFPDEAQELLHIITIGNKDEQEADIQFCREFVELIKKIQPHQAPTQPGTS